MSDWFSLGPIFLCPPKMTRWGGIGEMTVGWFKNKVKQFTEISLIFLETNSKIQTLLYIRNSNNGINVKMHIHPFLSFYKLNKFYIENSFPFFPVSKVQIHLKKLISSSLLFSFPPPLSFPFSFSSPNYNQTKCKF